MTGHVQVYTGDGKGKTTAAIGLAVRAAGHGWRVLIVQFIKGQPSGELDLLRRRCPEIAVEQYGGGRFIHGTPAPEDIEAARRGLDRLRGAVTAGVYNMVVADEANGAVACGLFPVAALLELIDARRPDVELVFTGRDAHPDLIARADLVTEMRMIKHYYAAGVAARPGIEK